MCCWNKHTHTEPAAHDGLGKAVHVGTAGICMKQSLFTMRKRKCLKVNMLKKYPSTLSHTHTYVEIFLSLRSAAISSVSLFLVLNLIDLIGAPGCGPITVRHQSHHATSSECFCKAGTHTSALCVAIVASSVACVPS